MTCDYNYLPEDLEGLQRYQDLMKSFRKVVVK